MPQVTAGGGGGAVYETTHTGGKSQEEKKYHINYLKLLAVFLGLKNFVKHENNLHVGVRIDNISTVSVVNHMGTSQPDQLNKLCKEIWTWAVSRNL